MTEMPPARLPDELREAAQSVLASAPCRVELPAGCGKTELIGAAAVQAGVDTRILILTHTNAGADALRRRLRRFGVPRRTANLKTIASWSSSLASAYRTTAGYQAAEPPDWRAVYPAAIRALESASVAAMVSRSYDYILVDEYQDCTLAQHQLISALADLRSTVVFGDPAQAIYDFGESPLVDWSSDLAAFRCVDVPIRAWRWTATNSRLGEFLLQARETLLSGSAIDLRRSPVRWIEDTTENRRKAWWSFSKTQGTAIILTRFDAQCQAIAKAVPGRFDVMEDIEGARLLKVADIVDSGDGLHAAAAVIDFAKASQTKLPATLTGKTPALKAGTFPRFKQGTEASVALNSLQAFAEHPTGETLVAALQKVEAIAGAICRKEAWTELRRSAVAWDQGAATLREAVRATRDRTRLVGRRLPRKSVSRAVLVKGMEFDHCLLTDVSSMNARELYVGLTRARCSVTIIADRPVIAPRT